MREKGQTEVAKTLETPVFSRGIEILTEKFRFISDSEVWLFMLKKRNTSVYIYNEDEVDEMILLIRDSFIPAFTVLKDTLVKKLDEAESSWM